MDEERAWFENRHLLQLHQMYVAPPTEEEISAMTTEEQTEMLADTPVGIIPRDTAMAKLFESDTAFDMDEVMEEQIRNIRTGDDAINFFARNGSSTRLKFIYCNRVPADPNSGRFAPYDLVAINEYQVLQTHLAEKQKMLSAESTMGGAGAAGAGAGGEDEGSLDKRHSLSLSEMAATNPNLNIREEVRKIDISKLIEPEYFTISASGIVHVQPGQPSEFLSIPEWISESHYYNVVCSIGFFKHFISRKLFNSWRRNARYDVYCDKRKRLSENLFFG
jgi:hypothetical protein